MLDNLLKCGVQRKYIVIKIEDLLKYVPSVFKLAMLDNDLADIADGRKKDGKLPINEYIVINADESYAPEVIEILKRYGHWDPQQAGEGERDVKG